METNARPRAAIYIRCARHEQFTADEQRKQCMEHIDQSGYQYAGEYIDMGANGLQSIRKAFDAMTIDAHIGEIDKVIVLSMARISRNKKDVIAFCSDLQESCGVTVESVEGSALL